MRYGFSGCGDVCAGVDGGVFDEMSGVCSGETVDAGLKVTAAHVFGEVVDGVSGEVAFDVGAAFDAAFGVGTAFGAAFGVGAAFGAALGVGAAFGAAFDVGAGSLSISFIPSATVATC